jgi:hypothetical protein
MSDRRMTEENAAIVAALAAPLGAVLGGALHRVAGRAGLDAAALADALMSVPFTRDPAAPTLAEGTVGIALGIAAEALRGSPPRSH